MSAIDSKPDVALDHGEEKQTPVVSDKDDSLDGEEAEVSYLIDWTPAEESKAKRKLDLIIMPILTLGFFCLRESLASPFHLFFFFSQRIQQNWTKERTLTMLAACLLFATLELDRGNISNAITDDFMEDVGISQAQFNVGQQMLSLGIVLFEIPSNMILYRVGPGKWLTLQLFLFGFVTIFQSFQHGYAAFAVTRFLLGITESGFIPGGLWTLSTWYTRTETAKRVMFFYFGNQFGQASSKLLAYGILHMRGVAGRPGWFWLFTLMGIFTVASGFVFGFFLPDSFRNPCPTFLPGMRLFSDREIHILRTRVLVDDPMKGKKKKKIGKPAFKKVATNWRLWCHCCISLFNNGPQRGFDTYAPTIVSSFGFANLTSNAMASVGLFIQLPVSWLFSWVSDRL